MRIEDIEGIGPAQAVRLNEAGVRTTDDLLERAGPRAGREALAAASGVSPKLLLEWVNLADLMRINGIGEEISDLLEAAGVDSPAELARRNAASLATTFGELDAARPNVVRRVPSESVIAGWIEQARTLPRVVEH